jgi:hypothetical protein
LPIPYISGEMRLRQTAILQRRAICESAQS